MNLSRTHTFVTLAVPTKIYEVIAEKLMASSYGHVFSDGPGSAMDMSGIAIVADPQETLEDWKVSPSTNVAVSTSEFMPMSSCPPNVKVQLLGEGGIPVYARWDGKDPFWRGWHPLPDVPDAMKDTLRDGKATPLPSYFPDEFHNRPDLV